MAVRTLHKSRSMNQLLSGCPVQTEGGVCTLKAFVNLILSRMYTHGVRIKNAGALRAEPPTHQSLPMKASESLLSLSYCVLQLFFSHGELNTCMHMIPQSSCIMHAPLCVAQKHTCTGGWGDTTAFGLSSWSSACTHTPTLCQQQWRKGCR